MATNPTVITELTLDDPTVLTRMVDRATPKPAFLRNHFLRVNARDIFPTDQIIVDLRDKAGNDLAPFVTEGHKSTERRGMKTYLMTPSRIAPKRKITMNDLKHRIWMEAVGDPFTKQARAMQILQDDTTDMLDEVHMSEEQLIAQLLQKTAYTYKNVKNDDGGGEEGEQTVSYVEVTGEDNCKFTIETGWEDETANPYSDINAVVRAMRRNGVAPTTLIGGANVITALLNHPNICKLLDNRRYELGKFEPQYVDDLTSLVGRIAVEGAVLNIVSYAGTYVDPDTKENKPLIEDDNVVLTYEGSVRGLYAGVSQVEQETHSLRTHLQTVTPKFFADAKNDTLEMMLTARPLFAPMGLGSFMCGKVTNIEG